jgi:HlyD family secretion protein
MQGQLRQIAGEDQLKRIDIRAPQDGIVLQSAVHTVGGVIGPGDQLMLIVPQEDALTVEAKISPQDIDQVHLGQPAILRFTSFNQRTTPELHGKVSRVSADVTQDQKTGSYYYTIRVSLPEEEVARLDERKLIAGMPVETFMQTTPRTSSARFTIKSRRHSGRSRSVAHRASILSALLPDAS